jgi:hypothetical protein
MIDMKKCPLCSTFAKIEVNEAGQRFDVLCDKCGQFIIHEQADQHLNGDERNGDEKVALIQYVRDAVCPAGELPYLGYESLTGAEGVRVTRRCAPKKRSA